MNTRSHVDSRSTERKELPVAITLATRRARTDRALGLLIACHVPVSLLIAPLHDTWWSAILVGGFLGGTALAITRRSTGGFATRALVSVLLLSYSGLLIHQSGGMIEVHFHIFSALAFLLMYRDWRMPVIGATVAALHHVSFNIVQAVGGHLLAFPESYHTHGATMLSSWILVGVHAVFVVFEAAVLVVMSRALEREAREADALFAVAMRLGEGDVTVDVPAGGGSVATAFRLVIKAIRGLVEETRGLAVAVRDGRLSARIDSKTFEGAYAEVVSGMNDTVAAAERLHRTSEDERRAAEQFLGDLSRVLERVAARDLTVRLHGSSEARYQSIETALHDALDKLDNALGQAVGAANEVANVGQHMAGGSESLARDMGQQAQALVDVMGHVKQLATMAEESATHAAEARTLTDAARQSADAGRMSMERLSGAIDAIKESADRTARIVKTIDEIAFQTNLLALNAAVEAARAGDAGRGFAVVADEVRALARRSAEAAQQTANLIEESVTSAELGVTANREALSHFSEIAGQVGRVSAVTGAIASSGERQAAEVRHIMAGTGQMQHVTGNAAASSEAAAATAEALADQAVGLTTTLAEFTLRR